jgi:hypothetical protein
MKNRPQMRLKTRLLLLTTLAILQPFIFFYGFKNAMILSILYACLGLVFTFICAFNAYNKWRTNGLFYLIWALFIPVMSGLVLYFLEPKMPLIDAFILMKQRALIVQKIKNSSELNQQLQYEYEGFLPLSIDKNVVIEGTNKDDLNLYFETISDDLFNNESGVLYSDNPEKIDTFEQRRTDEAGFVYDTSFKIKKIKPHWYIYEKGFTFIKD